MTATTTLAPELPACDIYKRYVRITKQHQNGLIEFEFSIGWTELIVELLLPQEAFQEFCAANNVEQLPEYPPIPMRDH